MTDQERIGTLEAQVRVLAKLLKQTVEALGDHQHGDDGDSAQTGRGWGSSSIHIYVPDIETVTFRCSARAPGSGDPCLLPYDHEGPHDGLPAHLRPKR